MFLLRIIGHNYLTKTTYVAGLTELTELVCGGQICPTAVDKSGQSGEPQSTADIFRVEMGPLNNQSLIVFFCTSDCSVHDFTC